MNPIQMLIKHHRFTQAQIAKELGVSAAVISKWKTNPDIIPEDRFFELDELSSCKLARPESWFEFTGTAENTDKWETIYQENETDVEGWVDEYSFTESLTHLDQYGIRFPNPIKEHDSPKIKAFLLVLQNAWSGYVSCRFEEIDSQYEHELKGFDYCYRALEQVDYKLIEPFVYDSELFKTKIFDEQLRNKWIIIREHKRLFSRGHFGFFDLTKLLTYTSEQLMKLLERRREILAEMEDSKIESITLAVMPFPFNVIYERQEIILQKLAKITEQQASNE